MREILGLDSLIGPNQVAKMFFLCGRLLMMLCREIIFSRSTLMILILSRVNNKLKKNGIRKVQKWGMMIFATLHDRLVV